MDQHMAASYNTTNYPDICLNGQEYELLCSFISKEGIDTDVYVVKGGTDAVILNSREAIIGLFSVEPGQAEKLVNYMDAHFGELICYEEERTTALLQVIREGIRQNSALACAIRNVQPPGFVSALRTRLWLQFSGLAEALQAHTVPAVRESNPKNLLMSEEAGSPVEMKEPISQEDAQRFNERQESLSYDQDPCLEPF